MYYVCACVCSCFSELLPPRPRSVRVERKTFLLLLLFFFERARLRVCVCVRLLYRRFCGAFSLFPVSSFFSSSLFSVLSLFSLFSGAPRKKLLNPVLCSVLWFPESLFFIFTAQKIDFPKNSIAKQSLSLLSFRVIYKRTQYTHKTKWPFRCNPPL